ncbi:MAG: D-aminoacyl-tRNA deacylase [Candidatus Parcubacteria bacterium]|nr:MAG: D-aminoacyl-tRNA deacylase [Candidatus Parcubacteria bacterium]
MKILIQKVKYAKCFVNEKLVSEIGNGYLIYLGIENKDQHREDKIIRKILKIKFLDQDGKFKNNFLEFKPEIMIIPNITLISNINSNRIEFKNNPSKLIAEDIYNNILILFQDYGFNIKTGIFGSNMIIESQNDGPINFIFDF